MPNDKFYRKFASSRDVNDSFSGNYTSYYLSKPFGNRLLTGQATDIVKTLTEEMRMVTAKLEKNKLRENQIRFARSA